VTTKICVPELEQRRKLVLVDTLDTVKGTETTDRSVHLVLTRSHRCICEVETAYSITKKGHSFERKEAAVWEKPLTALGTNARWYIIGTEVWRQLRRFSLSTTRTENLL